jgi:hypothetical protein
VTQEYEYNDTDTENTRSFYSAYWPAQTFTVGSAHYITSVKMKLIRYGDCSAYTLWVRIRATSGNLPTGGDLTSGSRGSLNEVPTTGDGALLETSVTQYLLNASTVYAVVANMNGDGSHYLVWKCANTNPYGGGRYCWSTNSGSSWTYNDNWDYVWQNWGNPPVDPPTVTTQAATSIGLD